MSPFENQLLALYVSRPKTHNNIINIAMRADRKVTATLDSGFTRGSKIVQCQGLLLRSLIGEGGGYFCPNVLLRNVPTLSNDSKGEMTII